MIEIATATPTEQLRLYRSRHRIEIDPSGDWTTCETDGLRVYAVRGRQWRHDQTQIARLEKQAEPLYVSETVTLTCALCGPGIHPSHNASPLCQSGGRAHCSCDVCF